MKKVALAFALILGAITIADAQYKPVGGEKNLEVSLAPLGGSPISIVGIKGRSWKSETSALRMTVFLGFMNETTITQDEDSDIDALETKDKSSSFSISVAPGIEKHMAGTDRLSPYVGAYVNIGFTSNTDKEEMQINEDDVATTTNKSGSLNLGINGVAGFDYYIAEHLYLGTEIGFGLALDSPLMNKTEYEGFDPNPDNVEGKVDNTSSFQIGPNVIAQFRLGWLFN